MDARVCCKQTGLLDQRPIALTPRFIIEKSIAQDLTTMPQITLTEAQLHLCELIAKLQLGKESKVARNRFQLLS